MSIPGHEIFNVCNFWFQEHFGTSWNPPAFAHSVKNDHSLTTNAFHGK